MGFVPKIGAVRVFNSEASNDVPQGCADILYANCPSLYVKKRAKDETYRTVFDDPDCELDSDCHKEVLRSAKDHRVQIIDVAYERMCKVRFLDLVLFLPITHYETEEHDELWVDAAYLE